MLSSKLVNHYCFDQARALNSDEERCLRELEGRLRTILPDLYRDCYEDVQPVSMGSAGLKFGGDGKVAWNEMWESFCDLAMAGGPPHKGMLLEPGSSEEIEAQPKRYSAVVEEICRGIRMVSEFAVERSACSGWVRVDCDSRAAAEWLIRANVMENISARWEGTSVELPAGPGYRLEKEIKNVITSIAKTSHYWLDHLWASQQKEIGELFLSMAKEHPLIQPGSPRHPSLQDQDVALGEATFKAIGVMRSAHSYAGWLGLTCPSVGAAVWTMRGLVASNVLARREGTALFVPVNPELDPGGDIVMNALTRMHRFATATNRWPGSKNPAL